MRRFGGMAGVLLPRGSACRVLEVGEAVFGAANAAGEVEVAIGLFFLGLLLLFFFTLLFLFLSGLFTELNPGSFVTFPSRPSFLTLLCFFEATISVVFIAQ